MFVGAVESSELDERLLARQLVEQHVGPTAEAVAFCGADKLAGFRAGAESLSRFEAASTFRSSMRAGNVHDGASAYRLVAYNDGCRCFKYTTPVRSSP